MGKKKKKWQWLLSQGTEQWVWCVRQLISDSNNNFDSFLVNDVGIKKIKKIKSRSRGIPVSILYQPVNEWRKSHLLDSDGVISVVVHRFISDDVKHRSFTLWSVVPSCARVCALWCQVVEALLRLWQQHCDLRCSQLCQDQKWVPGVPPSKELTELWPAA